MKKSIILGSILLSIVGCSAQPELHTKRFNVHSADFTKASDLELCAVYGKRANRSEEAKLELTKRALFSEVEWKNITNKKVIQGMSVCAVKAAYSIDIKKIKSSKFKNGNKGLTYIYECKSSSVPFCPYTRVDFVNNKVSGLSKVEKI